MTECPKCGKQYKGKTVGAHANVCGVTPEQLFWAKVDKSAGQDACWPWTASRTIWNYGHFRSNRIVNSNTGSRDFMSHRLAWELTNGPIPDGLVIMHSCDNPPCCNPAHMRLGTFGDNHADCRAKGRFPRGEDYKSTKLTDVAVREILALKPSGRVRGLAKQLADRYGVQYGAINAIWRGAAWSHIR